MVDHINFQRISPSLSSAQRVKRADQQNREQQDHPSFKKFLNQDEDKEKENTENQKDEKKSNQLYPTQAKFRRQSNRAPHPQDDETIEENYHGKRIDVHA